MRRCSQSWGTRLQGRRATHLPCALLLLAMRPPCGDQNNGTVSMASPGRTSNVAVARQCTCVVAHAASALAAPVKVAMAVGRLVRRSPLLLRTRPWYTKLPDAALGGAIIRRSSGELLVKHPPRLPPVSVSRSKPRKQKTRQPLRVPSGRKVLLPAKNGGSEVASSERRSCNSTYRCCGGLLE